MTNTKHIPRDPVRRRLDFAELIKSAALAFWVLGGLLIAIGVMWAV